jgi:TPR repeat protein
VKKNVRVWSKGEVTHPFSGLSSSGLSAIGYPGQPFNALQTSQPGGSQGDKTGTYSTNYMADTPQIFSNPAQPIPQPNEKAQPASGYSLGQTLHSTYLSGVNHSDQIPPEFKVEYQKFWEKLSTYSYRDAEKILLSQSSEVYQTTYPYIGVCSFYLWFLHSNFLFPKEKKKIDAYYDRATKEYDKMDELSKREDTKKGEPNFNLIIGAIQFYHPDERFRSAYDKDIFQYFTKAKSDADASGYAEYFLAQCYLEGRGTPRDCRRGITMLRSQVDNHNNNPVVCYYLGKIYTTGLHPDVSPNFPDALHYLKKAADDMRFTEACALLGACYGEGVGMQKDISQAIVYLRKAADDGHTIAQHNLGLIYEQKGDHLAVVYYEMAASQDYMRSLNNLAKFYENGMFGLPKDETKAFTYFHLAANQGYYRSQYNVAVCYLYGKGTKASTEVAIRWLQKIVKYADEKLPTPPPDVLQRSKELLTETLAKHPEFQNIVQNREVSHN